jgi:hypothetical protein
MSDARIKSSGGDLQRAQRSATHCQKSELKRSAKTQTLFVPRAYRADIDRLEREEMRDLKLG